MTTVLVSTSRRRLASAAATALVVFFAQLQVLMAGGAGAGLPWEAPLQRVANSLTGPVAMGLSVMALAVAAGTLAFGGELGEFARRAAVMVLAIGLLVFTTQFMAVVFAGAGALV